MSETPKDKAKDPRRVPPPISFPLPSTIPPRGREPLRLDRTDTIRDGFAAGSRNPIIETMDTDELTLLKRDSNRINPLGKGLPSE
jgi:hypothetical protein